GERRLDRRQRLEAEAPRSVGEGLRNFVIRVLPLTTPAGGEAVEILVHLKDLRGGEWHAGGLDVDVLQDVAVAGDFLLGPVSGLRAPGDYVRDTVVRSEDALDAVRGVGAFELSGVLERL